MTAADDYTQQPDERVRLRRAMEEQLQELGTTWQKVADLGGIKVDTVRRVRTGAAPIQQTTRRAIERGLGWDEGSVDVVLAGGEPTPLEAAGPQVATRAVSSGGSQIWITMPGGTPTMVPLVWDQFEGLEDLSDAERAALMQEMVGRMVHTGWEFLREEGQKRLKSQSMR